MDIYTWNIVYLDNSNSGLLSKAPWLGGPTWILSWKFLVLYLNCKGSSGWLPLHHSTPTVASSEKVTFLSRPCEGDSPAFVLGDRVCDFGHPLLCGTEDWAFSSPYFSWVGKGLRTTRVFSLAGYVYMGIYHSDPLPQTGSLSLPLAQ